MERRIKDCKGRLQFFQKLAIIVLLCGIVLSLPALCVGHSEENPSFKYSRKANENFDPKKVLNSHDHHHNHGHDHHHNQDHDHHHGHNEDHDHHHSHNEDHDHHHSHNEDHDHHLDHDHGHDHGDELLHDHDFEQGEFYHDDDISSYLRGIPDEPSILFRRKLDMSKVWLHSMISTLLISAAPFLLLSVIPLDNSDIMKPRLKVLLAFASGGLLGDAFLHLIPHATHPHTHGAGDSKHSHHHNHHNHFHHHGKDDHNHGHDMSVGLWVLAGIIAFLAVEKVVRLLNGSSGHAHSHGPNPKNTKKTNKEDADTKNGREQKKKKTKDNDKIIEENDVEIAGYLNLAADFAHNFTDGLAIGASYLAGSGIGLITTVTILLHEVPHEIGDFAILIKSGCSRRKAMLLQLVTALGAVAGTALALLGAASDEPSTSWVLPFTAGGFIYIATVSVLPELLEESTKLGQSIKEIVALLTGVILMVFIANFE